MSLQKLFLDLIKGKSKTNSSFVDDLADLLAVSKDSAYRRIRGETPLQFDEIRKLSIEYNVSVDEFFGIDSSHVTFQNSIIENSGFKLINFLKTILEDLKGLQAYDKKTVIFAAKDIPPFHFFQFPELTKFKLYFWLQNVENSVALNGKKYNEFTNVHDYLGLTYSLWESYVRMPSTEIWSDETVNIVLRHIFYFYDSEMLGKSEAFKILEELDILLEHIKKEAELGSKFLHGKPESGLDASFKLYYNEVSISDNTVFYNIEGDKSVILTYSLLNTLRSSDDKFCNNVEAHLKNIISKSSLISSASERMRNKVFNQMHNKVGELRAKIV